ncbi:hypothetical protein FJT64_001842 [Amphibalanus amphitrite]|uniref:Uncharacterized protein n=1 Tax=Amphibalanus amphitrite TaxID=1232801 RepID=A0A6A4X5B7_AMPAM|nr:hypothetical protein FJT64_001842 [Amphibalanus amphitrite]
MSTARQTRAGASKPLVGQPSEAVADQWAVAFLADDDTSGLLAFTGRPRLPTRGQVLSLYLYIRQVKGQWFPVSEIADIVLTEVCKYWTMGNIPIGAKNKTKEKTLALIDEYRNLGTGTVTWALHWYW